MGRLPADDGGRDVGDVLRPLDHAGDVPDHGDAGDVPDHGAVQATADVLRTADAVVREGDAVLGGDVPGDGRDVVLRDRETGFEDDADDRVPSLADGDRAPPPRGPDYAVDDLRDVVVVALERGGHLLTAGEKLVLDRVRALDGEPARLYARLTGRVPEVFALDTLTAPGVSDVEAAAAALIDADLADTLVPWDRRADASTREALADGCRALGLPVGGRRDDLVARLRGRTGWSARRWLRIRHRPLLRRMERWAFLRTWSDRSTLVAERLGVMRWPAYAPTPGTSLHADRRALVAWEALYSRWGELSTEECLDVLDRRSAWPPAGLDLRGSLRARALESARDRERQGDVAGARAVYRRLVDGRHVPLPTVAVRLARTHEGEGQVAEALATLLTARPLASPSDRIAIGRAGKRVARLARGGWAPDPPLKRPPERAFQLAPAPAKGPRPLYRVPASAEKPERDLPAEWALMSLVSRLGRRVVRGEGPLWTTLYALLLAPAYFLPIPGALPTSRLSGPVDVGTPTFADRRRDVVDAILARVDAGDAADLVRAADERYRGTLLAGASWTTEPDALVAVASALGPATGLVLRRLLAEGWDASRGLPDLVVLPGDPLPLPSRPSKLGSGPLLVEVKGPTDAVRDEQAAWFDVLVRAAVPIELWTIGG